MRGMKINGGIMVVTLLVLMMKTSVSQNHKYPMEQCMDVFESFMPCMGYVEGIYQQPSPDCCRGVNDLNNLVKFPPSGSRKKREGNGETERVCECIEIMGNANHLPFLPTAISNLPQLCYLTLSFPISVAMDCSQFRDSKDLDTENPN